MIKVLHYILRIHLNRYTFKVYNIFLHFLTLLLQKQEHADLVIRSDDMLN